MLLVLIGTVPKGFGVATSIGDFQIRDSIHRIQLRHDASGGGGDFSERFARQDRSTENALVGSGGLHRSDANASGDDTRFREDGICTCSLRKTCKGCGIGVRRASRRRSPERKKTTRVENP